jgi:hypothetical protein
MSGYLPCWEWDTATDGGTATECGNVVMTTNSDEVSSAATSTQDGLPAIYSEGSHYDIDESLYEGSYDGHGHSSVGSEDDANRYFGYDAVYPGVGSVVSIENDDEDYGDYVD